MAIDGGRVRLRERRRRQKGKGKSKRCNRKYVPQWREPKLLIIFELDEQGRMKRGTRPWIDGTLQGADELMELLAWHLYWLGARDTKSVTFLSDGAPWIWDRLDWFHAKIGLSATKAHRVLDWCHGLHRVSLALEALKPKDEVRQRIFSRLRRHLRAGGSTSCYPSFVRVPKASRRRQKYEPRSVTCNVMLHT